MLEMDVCACVTDCKRNQGLQAACLRNKGWSQFWPVQADGKCLLLRAIKRTFRVCGGEERTGSQAAQSWRKTQESLETLLNIDCYLENLLKVCCVTCNNPLIHLCIAVTCQCFFFEYWTSGMGHVVSTESAPSWAWEGWREAKSSHISGHMDRPSICVKKCEAGPAFPSFGPRRGICVVIYACHQRGTRWEFKREHTVQKNRESLLFSRSFNSQPIKHVQVTLKINTF